MRQAPLALLVVSLLLTGCTSDGNSGTIDPADEARQTATRESALWEGAAASHVGDVRIGGRTLDIVGRMEPVLLSAMEPRVAGASHFALVDAVVSGERGWLAFEATRASLASADGTPFSLREQALHADGSRLTARLAPSFGAPAPPANLTGHVIGWYPGLDLADATRVQAEGLTFHTGAGSRALAAGERVGTIDATLAALSPGAAALAAPSLEVPLSQAPSGDWTGRLTVTANAPTGELEFSSGTRLLNLFDNASVTMRGRGAFTLALSGQEWSLEQRDAEIVDVTTGPASARLEATARLVPDVLTASGPAGNATRVKLVLAETSSGADAHVTGYRVSAGVEARYVGYEPFALTNAMLAHLNKTSGPMGPAEALAIGITVPWIALGEAFFAPLAIFFPPSIAGIVEAGTGRVLTFDVEMPSTATDAEILIELSNAEPVRATVRLQPVE